MNAPIFINGTGKIDPSQLITVLSVPEGDNKHRILGFTSTGIVFELKKPHGGYDNDLAWHQITSNLWTR